MTGESSLIRVAAAEPFVSDDGLHAVSFDTLPPPSHVDPENLFVDLNLVRKIPTALGARALYIFVNHNLNPGLPGVLTSTKMLFEKGKFRHSYGAVADNDGDITARIDIDPRYDVPIYNRLRRKPDTLSYATMLNLGLWMGVKQAINSRANSIDRHKILTSVREVKKHAFVTT